MSLSILVMAALATGSSIRAHDNTPAPDFSRPAQIGTSTNNLIGNLNALSFKLSKEKPIVISLWFTIDKNGRVLQTQSGNGRFRAYVDTALHKSRLEPAVYDGKAVSVTVCATAALITTNGKPEIKFCLSVNPSDLLDAVEMTGPQRVVGLGKDPVYPAQALREGAGAEVVYRVSVDEKGGVTDAKIVFNSGQEKYNFDKAVLAAARKYTYIPGVRGAVPKSGEFEGRCVFEMAR
jgi:TonB family protein